MSYPNVGIGRAPQGRPPICRRLSDGHDDVVRDALTRALPRPACDRSVGVARTRAGFTMVELVVGIFIFGLVITRRSRRG